MDPRERVNDMRSAVIAAIRGRQSNIWTLLPAKIVSYDAVKQTCQIQPQIIIQWNNPLTGSPAHIQMPVISDCPVEFPGGGGYHLTFPIQPGDECTVAFSSRCIDGWWSTGAMSNQGDLRMHDLSDGFVRVGVSSLPHVIPSVSTDTVQLRSDDGQAYVEIAGGHVVNIVTPADVNITAGGDINLNATGKVTTQAGSEISMTAPDLDIAAATDFTGTVHANGHSIDETHLHSGVTTGGQNTGPVSP